MGSARPRTRCLPTRLDVEALESRIVPYALTGTAWPRPELLTLAVVADGTNLGGVSSNLVDTLNGTFGSSSAWQHQLLLAAQTWAQQTNLNFALGADSGAPIGSDNYLQGNAELADIRVGGFDFGRSALGQAYLPPPVNNFSIAGDTQFNTGQPWVINTTGGYDLFTVAMHEFGHALGLGHSTSYLSVMYPTYAGIRAGLSGDDIRGIRALYSGGLPRSHDLFDIILPNNTLATASYLDLLLDPRTLTAQATNLDITTTADADYFTVGVPAETTGTLSVQVQSTGLSMLMPSVGLYNSRLQLVGFATGFGQYGSTLNLTVNGVTPGERYYVCVVGADNSAFGTGRYALTFNFGDGPSPDVPLPNTSMPVSSPLVAGSALPETPEGDPDHSIPPTQLASNANGSTPTADSVLIRALTGTPARPAPVIGPMLYPISSPVYVGPASEAPLSGPFRAPVGGQTREAAVATEGVQDAVVLPSVEQTLPPVPETGPQQDEAMTPLQVRLASDIFFGGISWDATEESVDVVSTDTGTANGLDLAIDPLAAAACLAVVLGGHWTPPREEKRRRRPSREG